MRYKSRRRRERGITILEIAIAIGIGALILTFVVWQVTARHTDAKVDRAISDLSELQQDIRQSFMSQVRYSGLDNNFMYDSAETPRRMKGATYGSLVNAFRTPIVISTPITDANTFDIQYQDLTHTWCVRMLMASFGNANTQIVLDNTDVGTKTWNVAPGPNEASTDCSQTSTNDITWRFK